MIDPPTRAVCVSPLIAIVDHIRKRILSVGNMEKLKPLAAKQPGNQNGQMVKVATNLRRISLDPDQTIFQFHVSIIYFFRNPDGKEVSIEFSRSTKKGAELADDKRRCLHVYRKAMENLEALKNGGPFFYDRQSSMFSINEIDEDEISYTVTDGISRRPNFIRAEFKMEHVASFDVRDIQKTVHRCPSLADKTIFNALSLMVSQQALESWKVLTIGKSVHYLLDASETGIRSLSFREGARHSKSGITKSIKTLEGNPGEKPSIFLTTEMTTSLFHPDNYTPLIDLMKTFRQFSEDLQPNCRAEFQISKALIGLEVSLNYGKYLESEENSKTFKIRGFGPPSSNCTFNYEGQKITVEEYFERKYGIRLQFPFLMTAMGKGRQGERGYTYFPPELLRVCPNQKVTDLQMNVDERASLIQLASSRPHIRKETTENIVHQIGLDNSNTPDLLEIGNPISVKGILLEKPRISFSGGRPAEFDRRIPTDFNPRSQFVEPMDLVNWEIVFVENETIRGLDTVLMEKMNKMGMRTRNPSFSFIQDENLRPIFENARRNKKQLLFFVTKSFYNFHAEIKALEQEYDILTQDHRFEKALQLHRQNTTCLLIVNKTNMKLGGLNYLVESRNLQDPEFVVFGFSTVSRMTAELGTITTIGFSSNSSDHPHKFIGGYKFVEASKNVYSSIIKSIIMESLREARYARRAEASKIVIYFNHISDDEFSIVNDDYARQTMDAFKTLGDTYSPDLTVLAASRSHPERLYKNDQGRIDNLQPGTIVDSTIVSPVYNQWYQASAVARQGTCRTTKFTVIHSSNPVNMEKLENLTNELAYDHQIIFHPISLPVPLYLAENYAKRGAAVLDFKGPSYAHGHLDLQSTNGRLGYEQNELRFTRFNA